MKGFNIEIEKIMELTQEFGSLVVPSPFWVRQISVVWSGGNDLGARISQIWGQDFIGMYHMVLSTGHLKLNYAKLRIVLSDDKMFTGIGTSSAKIKVPTIGVPTFDSFEITAEDSGINDIEFDNDRQELLDFLYWISTRMLLFHELVHINNGHLDYLSAVRAIKTYIENERNGLTKVELQTLEMDADVISFQFLYEILVEMLEEEPEKIPEKIRSMEGLLYSLFLVSNVVHYRHESDAVDSIEKIKELDHLHPSARVFFNEASLFEKSRLIKDESLLHLIGTESTKVRQDLLDNNFITKSSLKTLLLLTTQEGADLLKSLNVCWAELRPGLQEFCTFQLPGIAPNII